MRGSRQYWPHRRAGRLLPRIREAKHKVDGISNIVAYKVGMATATMIDDSESPSKQQEISIASTILEVPRLLVYGIRFYGRNEYSNYLEAKAEVYDAQALQKIGRKPAKSAKLEDIKKELGKYETASALIAAFPKGLSQGQHHPQRFEAAIAGSTIAEKVAYIEKFLGKEISAREVFKPGEYVNISSISKGKGWQGVIKRYGVARVSHKSTQKVRHVGTLGPSTPGKVLFTVPQAGQTGFNFRTERNKRILKIANAPDAQALGKSGFIHYGAIRNDFIVIAGSIPGPAKRLVRIRKDASKLNASIKEPKVLSIG